MLPSREAELLEYLFEKREIKQQFEVEWSGVFREIRPFFYWNGVIISALLISLLFRAIGFLAAEITLIASVFILIFYIGYYISKNLISEHRNNRKDMYTSAIQRIDIDEINVGIVRHKALELAISPRRLTAISVSLESVVKQIEGRERLLSPIMQAFNLVPVVILYYLLYGIEGSFNDMVKRLTVPGCLFIAVFFCYMHAMLVNRKNKFIYIATIIKQAAND